MMLSAWLTKSHFVMLGLQLGFVFAHSGGAALRPWAEKHISPRLYRIPLCSYQPAVGYNISHLLF